MTSRDDWQRFLSEHEPFQDLPARLLSLIADRVTERQFKQSEALLRRGEDGDCLMVILDGRVRVSVPTRGGGYSLGTISRGGVVGEMALLTQLPRNADVTALTDTTALVLPVQAFEELLTTHHELAVVLTSLLAERLGQAQFDGLGETELEGFLVGQCIGRGGMAIVYRAKEIATGRDVALKMMSHKLVYDHKALRRFQREADVSESLQHEHIARLLGRFDAYKTFFLVMELCEGPTLQDLTRASGPFSEDTVRAMLGQVAKALHHVHGQGIVHRDLKPSNILIDSEGVLKLTDFGLARPELISDITQSGTLVGTPAYMSPEQLSGEEVDERADIYALGCTAFELITGKALFQERNLGALITRKVCYKLPAADDIRPGLAPDLYDLLERCLALDINARDFKSEEITAWAAPIDPSTFPKSSKPVDPDATTQTDFN